MWFINIEIENPLKNNPLNITFQIKSTNSNNNLVGLNNF